MKYFYQTCIMSLRGGRTSRRSNLLINWRLLRAIALATTLLINSCTALDALNVTPIPIFLTETPLPTPTINWFPPSATPTLGVFATNPPTPEMRPGLNDILLTDNFSHPSLWDIAASDQASANIDNNQITLAAQSKIYIASLRHELMMGDYYAEITARPNLCRGEDSYGLLIRASAITYYRFAFACNGTAHMDRLMNGIKLTLLQPFASADVPPGAPGEVRIGIWAVGAEMRLFLNGRFQFSMVDKSFPSGTIGVFVNSAGNTPAIVSFSDLIIQQVDYVLPTSTPLQ